MGIFSRLFTGYPFPFSPLLLGFEKGRMNFHFDCLKLQILSIELMDPATFCHFRQGICLWGFNVDSITMGPTFYPDAKLLKGGQKNIFFQFLSVSFGNCTIFRCYLLISNWISSISFFGLDFLMGNAAASNFSWGLCGTIWTFWKFDYRDCIH